MTPRTLVLVPPPVESGSALSPETMLLGLPLIRRTVLAARKAGFERIFVADSGSGRLARALDATPVEFVGPAPRIPEEAAILPWNLVLDTRALRQVPPGPDAQAQGILVRNASDLPRAEKWLLSRLLKDTEGFMSRHFERKISLALTRRLSATSITPNQMTLFSVATGLTGAPFFLFERPIYQTIGALLFLLHSIIDGCDGELARLKFQESRWGGILDFWGDNLVHIAVFAATAVGWSRSAGQAWPLLLGAGAVGGTLASAGAAYWQTMRKPKEGPLFTNVTDSTAAGSDLVNALSRRDFIYVVLALSLFGKANWFLALAAVGAPAFFVTLILLGRPDRIRAT
jgi:1L-myo-inositol 1-phosphate cytidylyltransferase / CDP-L-myo-inositol myo-inositolphosphotransferase